MPNPVTGEPHIYDHGVGEIEVEEALDDKVAEDRSSGNSRIVYGWTAAGRYLKIVYTPDGGFDDICCDSLRSQRQETEGSASPASTQAWQTKMKKKKTKLPRGWTQAKIDRLLRYHENQTDEQAIAEINRAFDNKEATIHVPYELVPVVRSLIAKYQNKRAARRR